MVWKVFYSDVNRRALAFITENHTTLKKRYLCDALDQFHTSLEVCMAPSDWILISSAILYWQLLFRILKLHLSLQIPIWILLHLP